MEHIPLAKILGEILEQPPEDLFIPPNALRIFLDSFEGPLDLLLYLIRKQNLNILDIPIARITVQYMEYIRAMERCDLYLAAEYLLMAAILIEIKSRLLLPLLPSSDSPVETEDPRAALILRLLEYEQLKQSSWLLDSLPRAGRDFLWITLPLDELPKAVEQPTVAQLFLSMKRLIQQQQCYQKHTISRSVWSVDEQMVVIQEYVLQHNPLRFDQLFEKCQERAYVVVCFVAILEMTKQGLLSIGQLENHSAIYLRRIPE
jgi:segregation and condensation protein A